MISPDWNFFLLFPPLWNRREMTALLEKRGRGSRGNLGASFGGDFPKLKVKKIISYNIIIPFEHGKK